MSYLINYLKNYLFIRSYKKKNKKSDAEHHHDDANDKKIRVCYSPKLFEQILW